MPAVPYTTLDNMSDADLEYLGNRMAKSPKIAEFLQFGKVQNDLRQLVKKLDKDTGVTDANYETEVLDD